ncbi:programmed cell death protein 4 [Amborella trichopoda]|uniref:MI domain-containing protein n=1 Tax=Amborella trichopoda TaxID=13333 RepID=W1P7B3_AMBTC|nr:programmed cell death protein 4 [Amborella trichopoda]ERN03808.1 hypothetical protein AMTR_s00078p00116560 [Amborella trichopoda]|eukprot:XP_006842133.1 programmed cell death protein 4 [Amborella trichopoda]
MEYNDGKLSEEHRELFRSATESVDPTSVSPLEVITSPRTPRTPRSPVKHGSNKGSPIKHERHSHTGRDGRPKKGGSGGKGIWGGLLEIDDDHVLDRNDPNYNSSEENSQPNGIKKHSPAFEEFRAKTRLIIEEYFITDDISSSANELRDLGLPCYHYYFVKNLVSMAMDRHNREKEMAALLLSSLYADVIEAPQVYRGFGKLVKATDDLAVDIPDAIDILALFIARAVVDDILPPAFLNKQVTTLPKDSKGIQVIKRAEKNYLSAPLHAEVIERRWGGSKSKTVEDAKSKINDLLVEYIASGDKVEACRCIKDLKMPFFHHEIVKRALILAMERRTAECALLDLLKEASEEGVINSSQVLKGFERLIDTVDDLSLDILSARDMLQLLISKAASEGWLCASLLKSLSPRPNGFLEEGDARAFKSKANLIIQEYFLSGDVAEVAERLESENLLSPCFKVIFVKRLISLAMDRKNREKEMASVLLSSLNFPSDDVVNGFVNLIEAAEDTSLDIPIVVEDLALFLARAMVDEAIAPLNLEEIESQVKPNSIGSKVIRMTRAMLGARLSGERILRCWGGDGSGSNGRDIEEVKGKIGKLLEEYDSGGGVGEACRCIREVGMPFFHHEVVKKSLVMAMERKSERPLRLLEECFAVGLISSYQMAKGFARVAEGLEDLALDVPDVGHEFASCVERAKAAGWLN